MDPTPWPLHRVHLEGPAHLGAPVWSGLDLDSLLVLYARALGTRLHLLAEARENPNPSGLTGIFQEVVGGEV